MKRIPLILLLLLMGAVQSMAQALLTVNKESYDLGQIEWNQPKVVEYTLKNTGDIPLIIANVTTSCACSVASWPKLPLQPNESGVIRVEFDARALGKFYKEVEVYTNATPNLIYLSFTGEVVRQITDFSQSHPVKIGRLRLNKEVLDFGDVEYGTKPTIALEVVNETGEPYTPVLMHTPSYLSVSTSELYLQQGERGTMKLVLDSELLTDYGAYKMDVYLSRFVGDKISKANRIPLTFTLLPDLSEVLGKLPGFNVDKRELDLRHRLQTQNKVSDKVLLTNLGQGDLEILKIQTFSPAVTVTLKNTLLKTTEHVNLKIKIDKSKVLSDQDNFDILLITNDPNHTKVVLKVLY